MEKLLFIVGSMRDKSFNKELAHKAAELLKKRADVSFLDYKDLPYMNQDLEADLPESVRAVRTAVQDADGIWIFTPEYNGMVPGVLKNLLDWLSRPLVPGKSASGTAVKGKPVTFSGAGGRRATALSRAQLETLLGTLMMRVMNTPSTGFAVPPEAMKSDDWKLSPEDIQKLNEQADAFLTFVGAAS